jgi:hypothetical protein
MSFGVVRERVQPPLHRGRSTQCGNETTLHRREPQRGRFDGVSALERESL